MNSVIEKEKRLTLALAKLKSLNLKNPNQQNSVENLNSKKNKLEIEIEQLCYAYNGNIPDKVWYKINKELNFIPNESIKKTNDNILLREFINYCLKFKLHSLLKTVNIDILNNLDFELLDKLIKFVSKISPWINSIFQFLI